VGDSESENPDAAVNVSCNRCGKACHPELRGWVMTHNYDQPAATEAYERKQGGEIRKGCSQSMLINNGHLGPIL